MKGIKRFFAIILFLLMFWIMVIPYLSILIAKGIDYANNIMDKVMNPIIELIELK